MGLVLLSHMETELHSCLIPRQRDGRKKDDKSVLGAVELIERRSQGAEGDNCREDILFYARSIAKPNMGYLVIRSCV